MEFSRLLQRTVSPAEVQRAVLQTGRIILSEWEPATNWNIHPAEAVLRCVLGSRVRYESAKSYSGHIWNILKPSWMECHADEMLETIRKELSKPLRESTSEYQSGYPFPNRGAKLTCGALQWLRSSEGSAFLRIVHEEDWMKARELGLSRCPGLGPKQASLLIRTLGARNSVAVLDTHVLRHLIMMQVTGCDEGRQVRNLSEYESIESRFGEYARWIELSIDVLDVSIWHVMRELDLRIA